MHRKSTTCFAAGVSIALFTALPALAQDSAQPVTPTNLTEFIDTWYSRVEQAQATQPHWITPVATVTPRLEEEFRYDQYWEHQANGASLSIFDGGKGLELIPTTTNEVLLNLPAFEERRVKERADGFLDVPFLTVKQRLLSEPETEGNYIVSAFLGLTADTGSKAFSNRAWIVTPTLAAGKGWGDFDIQATVGVPVPLSRENVIGTQIVTNVTFQYHLDTYFWPEFEVNHTYWTDGERGGLNQVFLTPGIVFGRFELGGRAKFIIGGSYQIAVAQSQVYKPALTPIYTHGFILTTRLTF